MFKNIQRNTIRKLARIGGVKKIPFIPYVNDICLKEGEISSFLQEHNIIIENGIINFSSNIIISPEQLKWFSDNNNNNPNFENFLSIWKLSGGLDSLAHGFIYLLDCNTIQDYVDFIGKKVREDDYFYIHEYNDDKHLLHLATLSEATIENELTFFQKLYSNISFIEHKIIHSNGWIRFPTYIKIEKLGGIIFFSNIDYKSNFGIENMCLSYKCQCFTCTGIKEDVKLELKHLLQNNYEQYIDIYSTGNFCSNCTRETTAKSSNGTFVCYNCVGKPRLAIPPFPL